MFSSWFSTRTPTTLDIPTLKNKAIADAAAQRATMMQTACAEFNQLFPTQPHVAFNESQQLFNPWMHAFYDALHATLYLPRALTLCLETLNTMETLAMEAEKCTNTVRFKELPAQLLPYQTAYDNIAQIGLALYGMQCLSKGEIKLYLNSRIPYRIGLKPFNSTQLGLNLIDISSSESASIALKFIRDAKLDISYNVALLKHYDISMLIAQCFIRMTPIFNQLSKLEKLASDAAYTKIDYAEYDKKFKAAMTELTALQVINTPYGDQHIDEESLTIQFGNTPIKHTIYIQLPTVHCKATFFRNLDLLSQDNAKDALSRIKEKKRLFCMQSTQHFGINLLSLVSDEDSNDEESATAFQAKYLL